MRGIMNSIATSVVAICIYHSIERNKNRHKVTKSPDSPQTESTSIPLNKAFTMVMSDSLQCSDLLKSWLLLHF